MKRIIMMVLRNLLFVPWGWFMLNRYAKNVDNYTEGERYALLKKIVRRANKGGNITVQSYGVENIPNENGFMFYPNHQGLYDVLAIVDVCPTPFSVVAKKEVGNVPFLKQVFTCMKAYIMDREDIRQSMQIILDVTKEVKAGRNYLIFAEGTRSKNGNHPREFKGGSFKISCRLSAGFSAAQCSLFVCLQRNLPGSHCPGSIKIVCAVIDHLKACNHGIVLA